MKELILYQGQPVTGRMPMFKPELRRAIREGRKTQTRRVIKTKMDDWELLKYKGMDSGLHTFLADTLCGREDAGIGCPYGQAGDIRCMPEPLINIGGYTCFAGDTCHSGRPLPATSLITGKSIEWRWKLDILSSIHMPTEAARTFTRYKSIRAERLQDISEEDAIAEGNAGVTGCGCGKKGEKIAWCRDCGQGCFWSLWDTINMDRGYSWESNPWVWVIEFEKIGE